MSRIISIKKNKSMSREKSGSIEKKTVNKPIKSAKLVSKTDTNLRESKKSKPVIESKKAKSVIESKKSKSVIEPKKSKSVIESKKSKSVIEPKKAKPIIESKKSKSVIEPKKSKPVIESKTKVEPRKTVKSGSKTVNKPIKSAKLGSNEVWKSVPFKDYKSQYQISSHGNVRNNKGLILSPGKRAGYQSVCLYQNTISKSYKIHRIVALAFVPNEFPEENTQVNHIDGNKLNNRADNLIWTTVGENNQHAIDTGLNPCTKRAVTGKNIHTGETKTYPSLKAAKEDTGIDDASISNVCNGKRHHAGGYIWKYVVENPNAVADVDLSEYKQIDGFPNYVINAEGKIYSLPCRRFMRYQKNADGSMQVQLTNNNNRKTVLVHRMVGCYFIKKRNSKHNSIHHIVDDKLNNNVSNLEWTYVKGVETPDTKYHIPYYDPETCVKRPKRKSAKAIEV